MKKVITIIALLSASILCNRVFAQTTFINEGFDSYPVNQFPGGGWVSYQGANLVTVTDTVFYSSHQSLQLNGTGGDASGCLSSPVFPITTFVETYVKTPGNLTNTYTGIAAIGIRYYMAINFFAIDSSIRLSDYYTGSGAGLTFAKFQPGCWCKVKFSYNKSTDKVSCWINDTLKIQNATIYPYPVSTFEFNYYISGLPKIVFLDDIIVRDYLTGVPDEQASDSKISLYPNPAHDKITIFTNEKKNFKNGFLTFYNMQGKVIQKHSMQPGKTEIDIQNLSEGSYYIKIESSERTTVKKFIRQ